MNMESLEANTPFLLLLALVLIRDVIVPLIKKAGTTIEQDIKEIKKSIGKINVAVAVLQSKEKE